jgi:phosphotransferase system IIA component
MQDHVKRFFTRAKGIRHFLHARFNHVQLHGEFFHSAHVKKSDTLRKHVKNLPPPKQKNQSNSNV